MKGLGEIVAALRALPAPAALATLVRAKGSSYRKPGARMLFRPGAGQTGLISAGCMETDVQARVAQVLAEGRPTLVQFDMGSELDLIWGTGMGCQGRAEVLLEPVRPGPLPAWAGTCARLLETRQAGAMATAYAVQGEGPLAVGQRWFLGEPLPPGLEPLLERVRREGAAEAAAWTWAGQTLDLLLEPVLPPTALWIYGAGEHAKPLFRIAKELGWFLGLADHRPALATAARFPEADAIRVGHPPAVLEGLPLDDRCAALVVSHVFEQDKAALAGFLARPLGYLGLQGNRKRSERIVGELEAEVGPLDARQRKVLHYPAGLDIGAESPEVIALAMIAEVQAALAGRSGGHLNQRRGSIH